ncbi:MAG: CPBP family intramembrane glutamic endopeptidase [Anaerolineales bacterium]
MTLIRNIFINPAEHRLRSGWRVLVQFILLLVLTSLLASLFLGLASLSAALGFLSDFTFVGFAGTTLSIVIARRWLDCKSVRSLGLDLNAAVAKDVLAGIVIAGIVMAVIFLAEWALGWLDFQGFAQPANNLDLFMGLGYWALAFLLVGFYEELLSRGYMLQNLAEGAGMAWAVFISSAIFGLLHLGNPGASWAATLGILGAGYFLAYGYLRTHQLWLPIGLHIGWNFFEGPIFSFPVSGLETVHLINHHVSGPVLFTGGEFGPEAGLIVLPGMLVGALLIRLYTRNRQGT